MTFVDLDSSQDKEEQDYLIENMIAQNRAIVDWLSGRVGADYVCDMLAQNGYGVDRWLETTIENLEYIENNFGDFYFDPEEVSTLITIPRWGYHLDEVKHET